jgi:hypothetical protein
MSLLCSKFDREKSFTAVSDLQNVTAEANKIFFPIAAFYLMKSSFSCHEKQLNEII